MVSPRIMLALLFALITLPVDNANALAGSLLGSESPACARRWRRPYDCPGRISEALDAVSDRELPREARQVARWYGRHAGDSGYEPALLATGHRRGILDAGCTWHRSEIGMSTIGPHGLMYVWNVAHLRIPGNCAPWWVLGFPTVSAIAAGRLYLERCHSPKPGRSWCPGPGATRRARNRRKR